MRTFERALSLDSKEDPTTFGPKEDPITRDPGVSSIIENPRKDPINQNPEENLITKDLKESQVLLVPSMTSEPQKILFGILVMVYHKVRDGDKCVMGNVILVRFVFTLVT